MQIMNKAAQRVWPPITAQRLGVLLLVVVGSLAMAVLLYVTALSVSQIRTGAPTAQHRSCATVVWLGCRDAVPDVRVTHT